MKLIDLKKTCVLLIYTLKRLRKLVDWHLKIFYHWYFVKKVVNFVKLKKNRITQS